MNSLRNLVSSLVIVTALAVPQFTLAALSVTFEAAPLFVNANLVPGDAVERQVVVSNNGTETETVEFTFDNVISSSLAGELELAVTDGNTVFVFDTFDEVFAGAPHGLGTLSPNETKIYTFTAAFPTSAGNEFQTEQFSFDLRIGFVGAEQVTDSSAGGGGGTQTLQLFNEFAVEEGQIDGALVTWNSNRRASTYLICGNVANGPFTLTDDAPLFGYEFSVSEEDFNTTAHGLAVTDLAAGDYECRPAGREDTTDGFTVGDAVQFTVALQGQVAGESISLSEADIQELLQGVIDNQLGSSVIGANSKGAGGMTYEEFRDELESRTPIATSSERLTPPATETEDTETQNLPEPITNNVNETSEDNESSFGLVIALIAIFAFGILLFLMIRR